MNAAQQTQEQLAKLRQEARGDSIHHLPAIPREIAALKERIVELEREIAQLRQKLPTTAQAMVYQSLLMKFKSAESRLKEAEELLDTAGLAQFRGNPEWCRRRDAFVANKPVPPADSKPLTYLAAPYSDPDPAVRETRFHAINKAASDLMRSGVKLFSPISHTHPIAMDGGLPTGFEYWEAYDRAMLSCCHRLIVLKLAGWDKSVGVAAEESIARAIGITVEYREPNEPANKPTGGVK